MKGFFITGVHTGIGKTVCSAVLVEALRADYWKPVQSGGFDYSDSNFVRDHARNHGIIHAEFIKLREPVSPHYAAKLEGKDIDIEKLRPLKTDNLLVAEGAGGVMSPLSDQYLITDLAIHLQLPVILVSMNYLGSINHTLLSIEALKNRKIPIAGILFNGMANPSSEDFILKYTGLPKIGAVPFTDQLSADFIAEQAKNLEHVRELVG